MSKKKDEAAPDGAPAKAGADKESGAKEAGAKEGGKRGKEQPAAEASAAAAPAAERKPKAKKVDDTGEGAGRKRRGRSMRGLSKKMTADTAKRPDKAVTVAEAVKLMKQFGQGRKFDQSVNIVMHLGIDPKQADQMIRGAVSLPHGIGKARKVICFADGEDAEKAKAAGAVEVGADELINRVNGGWMEFDVAVAHPRLMGKVGRLGKVLGPAGKMPSPKNGTVTPDVATAVREFAAGKVEFRNDAGGNIHGVAGKVGFKEADLQANIEAFIEHIRKLRPASAKGHYIKRVCVSATMSPSVEIAVAN